MKTSYGPDEFEQKRICHACVGEAFLSGEIKKIGTAAGCVYCGKQHKSITVAELADWVECAFAQHYRRTPTDPDGIEWVMQKESDYEWERRGDETVWAIANAAEIDEAPAKDVQKILEERFADLDTAAIGEECEFEADAYYEEIGPDDIEFREGWRLFERGLKTETRFFNRYAQSTLAELFEGLADHQTQEGRRVVIEAGPGQPLSKLYRARYFQADASLQKALERPDLEIGPPPAGTASPGRMNASGISVFYGATDRKVALAEIRPPVGSRVVTADFKLLGPLRLLDVEALRSVFFKGSIFDSGWMRRLERAKFLARLSARIATPVMPNDEASDYLITQAIADYLATEVKLDGMVYPSAEAGGEGSNVVLFYHAARVKPMELPPGIKVSTSLFHHTEDGPETGFWVWEELPDEEEKPQAEAKAGPGFAPDFAMILAGQDDRAEHDLRTPTLELDRDSVHVHEIEAVSFKVSEHEVIRHRTKKFTREY